MDSLGMTRALLDRAIAREGEGLLEMSYKNYHARGLDYLCLERGPRRTVKLYLLDTGRLTIGQGVVNPHDHRYNFATSVLLGEVEDRAWVRDPLGEVWEAHDYRAGARSFTPRGEERLSEWRVWRGGSGDRITHPCEAIHTLVPRRDQTALLQIQGPSRDVETTSCWTPPGEGPPTIDDGLYERFSQGEFVDRLRETRGRL